MAEFSWSRIGENQGFSDDIRAEAFHGRLVMREIPRSVTDQIRIQSVYPGDDEEKRDFRLTGPKLGLGALYQLTGRDQQVEKHNQLKPTIYVSAHPGISHVNDIGSIIRSDTSHGAIIPVSFVPGSLKLVIGLGKNDRQPLHHGERSETHRDTEYIHLLLKGLDQYFQSGHAAIITTPAELLPPYIHAFDILKMKNQPTITALRQTVGDKLTEMLSVLGVHTLDSGSEIGEENVAMVLKKLAGLTKCPELAEISDNTHALARWMMLSTFHVQWRSTKNLSRIVSAPSILGSSSSFDDQDNPIDILDCVYDGRHSEYLQYVKE